MDFHFFGCGIFYDLLFLKELFLDSDAFGSILGHILTLFKAEAVSEGSPELEHATANASPDELEEFPNFG